MNECVETGYLFLIRRYSLAVCELYCQSFVTNKSTKQIVRSEHKVKTYYPARRFSFEASWQGRLTFALKYEGINSEVLKAFFNKVDVCELKEFITGHPLGTTQRRIWFLYEYLTGKRLDIQDGTGGSYVPLVDDSLQSSERRQINAAWMPLSQFLGA